MLAFAIGGKKKKSTKIGSHKPKENRETRKASSKVPA